MKNLQIESGPPINNDDCPDAFIFYQIETFDSSLWTTDGLPEPGLCGPGNNVFQDGWFIYTAECSGLVTFTMDGVFGTRILVYDGHCGLLVPIACSADTGCGPEKATVTFPAEEDFEYILRVGSCEEGQSGVATLAVSCATIQVPALPPAGAVCLIASLLLAGIFALGRRKAPAI